MIHRLFSGLGPSTRFLIQHEGFSSNRVRCLWQVLKWYLNVVIRRNPRLRIKEWMAAFTLPCNFRSPAKVFYVFGRDYEPEIRFLETYLQPGDVFVDGGANFGLYTVLASHYVGKEGKVLAFEPFPASHAIAKLNIELNNIKNADLFQTALSDNKGEAQMGVHHDPGRNSLSLNLNETVSTISISTNTFDELWVEKNLPNPSVIKLDVEGHERNILMGAERVIAAAKPTIIFELNPPACERSGYPASAVPELLKAWGYNFYTFSKEGLLPTVPCSGDYVAIHLSKMHEARHRNVST